ncbi:hypothetical protein Glove_104g62 [Diversispora epigaea]|uniref:Uncharacterized protein n=1 Tax=Diversispora epigaea TaxID=1348612 RepID=A0A397J366_9GLOM|nr:hypothetical protein Glove_104g62 [Diversispora epigaea]
MGIGASIAANVKNPQTFLKKRALRELKWEDIRKGFHTDLLCVDWENFGSQFKTKAFSLNQDDITAPTGPESVGDLGRNKVKGTNHHPVLKNISPLKCAYGFGSGSSASIAANVKNPQTFLKKRALRELKWEDIRKGFHTDLLCVDWENFGSQFKTKACNRKKYCKSR